MSRSILVVDDSSTIRRVVELTLGDAGYRVEAVATGAAGLEAIERVQPDLILADASMSPPSGFDICRAVKRSSRPVPVVLLAGTFDRFEERQAKDCGADGFLQKPFDSELLLERVRHLLENPPVPPARVEPQPAETDGDAVVSADQMERICDEVVRRLTDDAVREMVRRVLPGIAERVVQERIRELENGEG